MRLEEIVYNIFYMTNISFSIYENNKKIYYTNPMILPDAFKTEIIGEKQIIVSNHHDNKILRIQDYYGLTFLCLYVDNKHVVVGPYLINDDFEKHIDNIIFKFHLINEEATLVENFYNNLQILNESQQNLIVNTLHGLEVFSNDDVKIHNVQIKKVDPDYDQIKKINDYNIRQVEKSNEIEETLLKIVRTGDIDSARVFDFTKITSQHLIYKNNSFTNMKTNLMIFDAFCNREAIKSGIELSLAYKLSINTRMNINKISISSELRTLAQKILVTYAKAVKDYTLLDYSNNIRKIILYIRKNLTNKISLDDIANELFITKEHLSRLFKKEMGLTISEYIIKAKIEEAKKLLKITDYNILDIATLLNFANSSHFSNSFKKYVLMSPSDYRRKPNDH